MKGVIAMGPLEIGINDFPRSHTINIQTARGADSYLEFNIGRGLILDLNDTIFFLIMAAAFLVVFVRNFKKGLRGE